MYLVVERRITYPWEGK